MPATALGPHRAELTTSLARASVLGGLALALATVHLPGRPSTLCLLRSLTGVPCPFCGGTTAAAAIGRLDLVAALRASPAVVTGAAAFALAPLFPKPAHVRGRRLIVLLLGFAELWQLARFGLL